MNNEVKKVLFIINKFAGIGYKPLVDERIALTCESEKIHHSIEYTLGKGHATTLAREAAQKGFDCVVAVGGDGTLNEVAQGLLNSQIPMGIIPRGSGNGLARHLGVPMNLQDAVSFIFKSDVVAIDTFTLNEKLSLNVSGIGFDGHIANLFGGKTKRGLTGYAKLAMTEFMKFKEFDAEITINNITVKKTAFVIATANSSQYGNNARIAPLASVRDQLLHVNILKKVPAYRFDFVYSFFAGSVATSPFCEILQIKNMQVKTYHPMAYHVDGEPCGVADQFNIMLQPSALQVLVPRAANRKGIL